MKIRKIEKIDVWGAGSWAGGLQGTAEGSWQHI